jgi:exonuclease VII large subunit
VRAATPSNAAQLLVPDRRELIERSWNIVRAIVPEVRSRLADYRREVVDSVDTAEFMIAERIRSFKEETAATKKLLRQYDPTVVLARGYALVHGMVKIGNTIEIERTNDIIKAEVRDVSQK